MKTWNTPSIEACEISATAFGPTNPDNVDEVKYAVTDENGNVKGWEELYGEPESSSK